jgi:hypothetical protein
MVSNLLSVSSCLHFRSFVAVSWFAFACYRSILENPLSLMLLGEKAGRNMQAHDDPQ